MCVRTKYTFKATAIDGHFIFLVNVIETYSTSDIGSICASSKSAADVISKTDIAKLNMVTE